MELVGGFMNKRVIYFYVFPSSEYAHNYVAGVYGGTYIITEEGYVEPDHITVFTHLRSMTFMPEYVEWNWFEDS